MLDEFRFKRWQIAYRIVGEEKYRLVPNPPYGWCADPFLVEYRGTLYLFAEIYLYQSERNGVIGYCTYENNKFSPWTITMDKHWHLSYPNVFVYEDHLYMCPESYQKEEVGIYKLIEFPDRWEQTGTLLRNGKYVDTTFLQKEGQAYLFTFQPSFHQYGGALLQYRLENDVPVECCMLTDDRGRARPGGNFFRKDGKTIRVSQDSEGEYGGGLVFSEVDAVWPEYREHVIRKISAKEIEVEGGRKYIGIHTYNTCKDMEVIDLKYCCYSWKEWMARKRVRKVFVNKYGA